MRFLAIQAPLTRSYKQLLPARFERPFLETKVFLHFLQEHPLPGHPFQNLQFAFLIFGAKNPQYVGIQCQYYNCETLELKPTWGHLPHICHMHIAPHVVQVSRFSGW